MVGTLVGRPPSLTVQMSNLEIDFFSIYSSKADVATYACSQFPFQKKKLVCLSLQLEIVGLKIDENLLRPQSQLIGHYHMALAPMKTVSVSFFHTEEARPLELHRLSWKENRVRGG